MRRYECGQDEGRVLAGARLAVLAQAGAQSLYRFPFLHVVVVYFSKEFDLIDVRERSVTRLRGRVGEQPNVTRWKLSSLIKRDRISGERFILLLA